jgi:hypothetical protein
MKHVSRSHHIVSTALPCAFLDVDISLSPFSMGVCTKNVTSPFHSHNNEKQFFFFHISFLEYSVAKSRHLDTNKNITKSNGI